jgi:hypothetical protein
MTEQITQPGLTPTEQAAEYGADKAMRSQAIANKFHENGELDRAVGHQEDGAMEVGIAPIDEVTGKEIPISKTGFLLSTDENGKDHWATAEPKAVMDVLHGRALEENQERNAAAEQAAADAASKGWIGKLAARFKTTK